MIGRDDEDGAEFYRLEGGPANGVIVLAKGKRYGITSILWSNELEVYWYDLTTPLTVEQVLRS